MASRKPPQAALATKSPTTLHTGLAEYIKTQTGYEPDVQSVSLAVRLTAEYRASDDNRKRREASKAEKAKAVAEREKAAKAKIAERARKLREQAEALEAKAGVKPARKSRATGVAAVNKAEQKANEKADAAEKRAKAKAALSVVPDLPADDVDDTVEDGDEFVTLPGEDDNVVTLPAPTSTEADPVVLPAPSGVTFSPVDDGEDDDF